MTEEAVVISFVLMLTKVPVIIGKNNWRKCRDYKGKNGVREGTETISLMH